MSEAILIDNILIPTPANVLAVDTPIYTSAIKSTVYDNIRFDATVAVSTTGASAAQAVNLKLFLGGTLCFTWAFDTLAEIRDSNVTLSYIGNNHTLAGLEKGGVLEITLAGAGADAITTVTPLNVYVTSVDI